MVTKCLVVLALLLAGLARSQEWRAMFDGKSFAGWKGPGGTEVRSDSWAVENGELHTAPGEGGHDLFSGESFGDFELSLEWKVSPGANSGIFYNILDAPKPDKHQAWWHDRLQRWTGWHAAVLLVIALFWFKERRRFRTIGLIAVILTLASAAYAARRLWVQYQDGVVHSAMGLEMQVLDDQRHADAKNGPDRHAGALYAQFAPSRDAARPAGEWNEARIVVLGPRVEHWLNGEKVVEYEIGGPEFMKRCAASKFSAICNEWGKKRRSPIALQHHDDLVWFRNIRVRAL